MLTNELDMSSFRNYRKDFAQLGIGLFSNHNCNTADLASLGKLQPWSKLLRQLHLFSNFCAILPSPLNRKSKVPSHPLFKVVLV